MEEALVYVQVAVVERGEGLGIELRIRHPGGRREVVEGKSFKRHEVVLAQDYAIKVHEMVRAAGKHLDVNKLKIS